MKMVKVSRLGAWGTQGTPRFGFMVSPLTCGFNYVFISLFPYEVTPRQRARTLHFLLSFFFLNISFFLLFFFGFQAGSFEPGLKRLKTF